MKVASLQIARANRDPTPSYHRTHEVVDLGLSAPTDLLAGQVPGVEALYRVGLGDLVARARVTDRGDPVRILARNAGRILEPLPIAG